jgi:hypothetical protein
MTHPLVRSVKQRIQSWFTQAQAAAERDEDLVELPDIFQAQLNLKIQALPSPQAYQTAVQEAIAQAVQTWQIHPEASNSLVMLGSPVEPIAKILHESLQNWADPPVQVITPLPCLARPRDPLTLPQQIREALQRYTQVEGHNGQAPEDGKEVERLEKRTTLIVIPCLEQCFLRCIGGWESIEFLRDLTIHHPQCFWVMGCNHWAWDFLDFVCQISAYFNEIYPLPELEGPMLQEWLNPVTETVVSPKVKTAELKSVQGALRTVQQFNPLDDSQPAQDKDRRQIYWEALSNQSLGVSRIAANLWFQSLRMQPDAVSEDQLSEIDLTATTDPDLALTLRETKPLLPSLPSLTDGDRYLLQSVLLHGHITRAHLALTLGESESQIQAYVQRLLREKVLEQRQGVLTVQAAHYPKLKGELANNNFFVSED